MRTSELGSLLDLERDLPTTEEDVEALRKHRPTAPDDWWTSLQQLANAAPPASEERPRRTFAGCQPFEL